jgi:hypothetical protein
MFHSTNTFSNKIYIYQKLYFYTFSIKLIYVNYGPTYTLIILNYYILDY